MLFKDGRRLGRVASIEYGSRSDQPDALIVRRRFYERPRLVRIPAAMAKPSSATPRHRTSTSPTTPTTSSYANQLSGETNALTVKAGGTQADAMGRRRESSVLDKLGA